MLNPKRYLCINIPFYVRTSLAKFRCSNHQLLIEIGRHLGITREQRILNWWKGKPSGSIACTRKQQPRFYWSCSSVVMNNATPLTPPSARAELYFQISIRRRTHRLILFYKMYHALAPRYLSSLIPSQVGNITSYNLRNTSNLLNISCRSQVLNSCQNPSFHLQSTLGTLLLTRFGHPLPKFFQKFAKQRSEECTVDLLRRWSSDMCISC